MDEVVAGPVKETLPISDEKSLFVGIVLELDRGKGAKLSTAVDMLTEMGPGPVGAGITVELSDGKGTTGGISMVLKATVVTS